MTTVWRGRAAATRAVTRTCLIGALVLGLGAVDSTAQQPAVSAAASGQAAAPFRVEPPLRSFVVVRRLESRNARHKKEAWLRVRTELREDGSFHYTVLEEGGSEFLRRKVLHEALEKEAQAYRDGRARRASLTPDNYRYTAPVAADGVVRHGLVPRRKDEMFVKGSVVTTPEGDILRVEGELVKRPSFWTRSVHLTRHYSRVAGAHVAIRLEMVAQVLLAGTSTLTVTYDYEQVNGRPVQAAGGAADGATRTAQPQ